MIVRIIADLLIAIGAIFALAGVIGILKMPDTYSRMQATTCIATLNLVPCTIDFDVCYGNFIILIELVVIIAITSNITSRDRITTPRFSST